MKAAWNEGLAMRIEMTHWQLKVIISGAKPVCVALEF